MATKPPIIIGWRESVALPELGIQEAIAKIDTGARTSAIHATRIKVFEKDGQDWVRFHVPHAGLESAVTCEARLVDRREIKNTSGIPQERLVIETQLVLGTQKWKVEVSLANRANMNLPLILGRTAIRRRNILVHPGRSHLADGTRKDHK